MKKQLIIRRLMMISTGLLFISCSNQDAVRSAKHYSSKGAPAKVYSQAATEINPQVVRAKTIANMLGAFETETKASARYAQFSEKARVEGYPEIAALLKATSEAEDIHASNHLAVLVNMGINVHPVDTAVIVKSTEENLKAAIVSEAYSVNEMYPLLLGMLSQPITLTH